MKFTSDIVAKYQDLATKIADTLEVVDGTIKEKESHGAYFANLPEGLTKEGVTELTKYNSKYVTSTHIAAAQVAGEVMKKNKGTDRMYASVGFFGPNDTIDIQIDRSKTFTNHLAKDENEKEITKHLHMSTTVNIKSAKGISIKAVKDSVGEEFKGMFNK